MSARVSGLAHARAVPAGQAVTAAESVEPRNERSLGGVAPRPGESPGQIAGRSNGNAMAKTLEHVIDELVGREGGYTNHPADRGGPTRWGVTEQVARAYGYRGDMRALPRETAEQIYLNRFWFGPKFDKVFLRYARVAEELLDTGVNMGQAVAAGFLQRALNLLNRESADYPDIVADGQIGPMTLQALDQFKTNRGAAGEAVLLKALDGFQVCRYADITEARPRNEAFFYGWIAHRIGQA